MRRIKKRWNKSELEADVEQTAFSRCSFGLMVIPGKYVMSAIIKKEGKLVFGTTEIPNKLAQKTADRFLLDVDAINQIHTYVYSVLTWSSKTACKFGSE